MQTIDLVVVAAYLGGITLLGLLAGRRQGRTSAGYFLAGRSLRWTTVGLALFATNISTVHLIGLASSGYADGLVIGNFEWLAPLCLILLGLVFAPFYFRTRIATLPEFLEGRFSPGCRTFLAFLAVVGALFIHIGVTLYAGAVVFQRFAGVPIELSILAVSLLTVIYTVAGGLKAVMVTEAVQTVLLLLGAVTVTLFGAAALHGRGIDSLDALRRAAKPGQLDMLQAQGDFAWWIMLLGYPVIGVWYWCADQTIVQRVLGARSERDARAGPIFAGFIKVLPVPVMVLPGVMGYVLFKDRIGTDADATLVVLVQELLPPGLKGLVVAGLLAALMSTVAGALNSTATLVSMDIVKRLRPGTPDRILVRIGRITAVAVMIAATAWSTQGERFGGIFKGINQMICDLAPPVTAVFLWGVFWKRGTARAALATLLAGFVLGAAAFVLDFPAVSGALLGTDPAGKPVQWVTGTLGIPFMLQAFWLFVICSVLFAGVSLCTPPPDPARIERYCWRRPLAVITASPFEGILDPRLLACLLLAVMAVCYTVFA